MNLPVMKSLVLAAAFIALPASAALAKDKDDVKPAAVNDFQATAVPDAVKSYVVKHAGDPFPSNGAQITVGRPVDAGGVWRSIPDFPAYRFNNLSGQLVVVDSKTNKVVAVY
jgi:hypothetical protein